MAFVRRAVNREERGDIIMPETGTLLVALASLVTSAVVPFLSIYFAQRLVRQDTLRREARDALLRVNKDVQDYRTAFLAHYLNVLHEQPNILGSSAESVGKNG
jgi:hypothetical protein